MDPGNLDGGGGLRERLKGRIASPGRTDQPNDAFSVAACVLAPKNGDWKNGQQKKCIVELNHKVCEQKCLMFTHDPLK
jgi:hypothetical protein